MKKFVSLVMAGAMIASMAVAANAVYEAEADAGKVAFDVPKARVDVKFDGVITEGEYYPIELKDSWISYAANVDAGIETGKALEKELYMSWDDDGINLATVVYLDEADYVQTQDAANMWNEACIQVNFAAADAVGQDRLEYGIAKSTADDSFLGNVWAQKNDTYTPAEGDNAYVGYSDGKLVYETSVDWDYFLDAAAAEGDEIGFCVVWSIGTAPDYIHVQLAHGCTGDPGKAADGFAKLSLVAAPEIVEPEEPATEGGEQAAQTADFGIIVSAVLFAASAAGVVVATRKKH